MCFAATIQSKTLWNMLTICRQDYKLYIAIEHHCNTSRFSNYTNRASLLQHRQVLKLTNRASLLQHRQVLKLYQPGITIVAQAGSQTHILASPKLHSKYTQSDNLQEKRVFYTFMAKFVLLIAKCVMLMVKCAIFMVMCVWYWC